MDHWPELLVTLVPGIAHCFQNQRKFSTLLPGHVPRVAFAGCNKRANLPPARTTQASCTYYRSVRRRLIKDIYLQREEKRITQRETVGWLIARHTVSGKTMQAQPFEIIV